MSEYVLLKDGLPEKSGNYGVIIDGYHDTARFDGVKFSKEGVTHWIEDVPEKPEEKSLSVITQGMVDYAVRKAMDEFDKWNDVTGTFQVNTGSYGEIAAVIEDSVHIGIQMAMFGKINRDKEGNVLHK